MDTLAMANGCGYENKSICPIKTPFFKSPVSSIRNSRASTFKNSKTFENNSDMMLFEKATNIHYIDQAPPNRYKATKNSDLDKLLHSTNWKTTDDWVNKFLSYENKAELLQKIMNTILEHESFNINDHDMTIGLVNEAFKKAADFDDMKSIIWYTKKLLKCQTHDQIITRIKQLVKRKQSKNLHKKGLSHQNDFELEYKKAFNLEDGMKHEKLIKHLQTDLCFRDKIDQLIYQLGKLVGLKTDYDQYMILKWVIKYFDKYSKPELS